MLFRSVLIIALTAPLLNCSAVFDAIDKERHSGATHTEDEKGRIVDASILGNPVEEGPEDCLPKAYGKVPSTDEDPDYPTDTTDPVNDGDSAQNPGQTPDEPAQTPPEDGTPGANPTEPTDGETPDSEDPGKDGTTPGKSPC